MHKRRNTGNEGGILNWIQQTDANTLPSTGQDKNRQEV